MDVGRLELIMSFPMFWGGVVLILIGIYLLSKEYK